jgi:hypothetical protein
MSGHAEENPQLAAAARARAAQTAATARAALAAMGEGAQAVPLPVADPLPLCIYTTVAVLAWCLSPALVAALFALAGLHAYARAWRAGLRKSSCVLGDPRLVMLYLGLVALAGLSWTAWQVARTLLSHPPH